MDGHLVSDGLGKVVKVSFVLGGDDNVSDSGAVGGEEFFADASDGEDFAAEGDFAGHGEVGADGSFAECGDEGGEKGDTGGGPVFGDGAFGDVDVDIEAEFFGRVELLLVGAKIAHGGHGGLFHDIAEGAGEADSGLFAVGFGEEGFDGDDVAAVFAVDEAGGGADFGFLLFVAVAEARSTEEFGEVFGGDFDGLGPAFGDFSGGFPADRGDFSFEGADAGFSSVVADDSLEGGGGDGDL